MKRILLIAIAAALVIGSILWFASTPRQSPLPAISEEAASSSSSPAAASSVSSEPLSEPFQTFQGRVQPLEASVYMEGTHRLVLHDGAFLLLSSDTVSLQAYEGKQVEATGVVQDAVEGGIRIMAVKDITLLASDEESSSSSPAESASSSSPPARPAPRPPSSAARSSLPAPTPPPASAQSSASAPPRAFDAAMLDRMRKMAKPKPESAWTQQYCSSHIGVCFPVRADYWYRSFGASTASLWHVEINSEDIANLGDGPLTVNLVAGRLDPSIADQSVAMNGDFLFGYRSWTGNQHFEVAAPAELRAAVEYITRNIIPYEPPAESSSTSSR